MSTPTPTREPRGTRATVAAPTWLVAIGVAARQVQETSLGSGVVLDGQGHILTADHVVANAGSIDVTFQDGTTRTVLGGDAVAAR
jgi:putative serine protease PepD